MPDDVINTRRKFMSTVQQESTHLYAMYPHGDWMHVYVFDKKKSLPELLNARQIHAFK